MIFICVNSQEVKEEIQNKEAEVEVIQITGTFSRNLESALSDKKMSDTISDGISADDIGSLPALDLGEALQAVPGVHLPRAGARRESSVNLRGLPSGFVLTTANGQTISGPTRSESPLGAANPFGAYDAAIFNGIRVIKSPKADMVEGGIAGTVDQQLVRALSAPESSLKVSLSSRYEELSDNFDPEGVISGSKHFDDGKFAVAGTVAWSKQSFRRDTVKINRYDALNKNFDSEVAGQSYEEWAAGNSLPTNAVVQMPGEVRQATESNNGDRLSISGGLEWQPTEQLTFGANVIYTKRDMDDNGYQQVDLKSRIGGELVNPLSAPRNTGTLTESGDEIWSVADIAIRDVRIGFDSREWDLFEESSAYIFDGVYQGDEWELSSAITISSAEAQWDEVLLAQRFKVFKGGAVNPLTARLYTGEGDISDYVATIASSDPSYWDVGTIDWPEPKLTLNSSGGITGADRRQFGVTGTFENIERDSQSFEFNAERYFDSPITSVKFGYRYSSEDADSNRYRQSANGIDMNQVGYSNDTLTAPTYTEGDSFFGGNAPGYISATDGWLAFDAGDMINALTATIPDLSTIADSSNGEKAFLTGRGFIQRGGQQNAGLVYDTAIDSHAAFVMANFDLELGDIPVTGNFGVRYVSSDVEASAPLFDINDVSSFATLTSKNDYDYLLPSVNISAELMDDLVLRVAYSEGIVRPNLRAAKPASTIQLKGDFDADEQTAEVTLPGVDVDPFEASSYDVSLEWYNRDGSAITFAVFRKDISNFFTTMSSCDNDALAQSGFTSLVGSVSLDGDSCISSGVDGVLQAGSEVNISQVQNIANDISVNGYEVSIQQNLDFLPEPWSGFGGILNYSHTSQSSDGDNDVKVTGISDDTYNAIAYYEQESFGIRLAYNYRSDYELDSVGTFNGAGNKSVKAAGRLDLSAYYNITEDTSVSFKAYNLTESLYEEYESVEWQPRATHFDGRVFVLSINHTFF